MQWIFIFQWEVQIALIDTFLNHNISVAGITTVFKLNDSISNNNNKQSMLQSNLYLYTQKLFKDNYIILV